MRTYSKTSGRHSSTLSSVEKGSGRGFYPHFSPPPSSSSTLRRSTSLNSCVVTSRLRRSSPFSDSYSLLPSRSISSPGPTSDNPQISTECCYAEKLSLSDGWRERSSLLRRLVTDYPSGQIEAALFPMSAATSYFQSLEDREKLLQTSPFPLCAMEDVIVNTPCTIVDAALSAGRLYRKPVFLRELGAANPEWNLAHSYPFQSLAFRAFSQVLNSVTPLHAMYVVAYIHTCVNHSSVNEQLVSELRTSQQLYLTEGFQRCQAMCRKVFPDLDFYQVPYTEDELADRLLSDWTPSRPCIEVPASSSAM